MHVLWEQLGVVVKVLGSQSKSLGFESHMGLAVVTIGKINPIAPACLAVNRDFQASAVVAKRANCQQCHDLVGYGWTSGANITPVVLLMSSC